MADEPRGREDGRIHLAFDRDFLTIPVAAIVPLKTLPNGAKASRSYSQVLSSIKAIGLIEAPVVMADEKNPGTWFLLDGHLRLEALKELGIAEVECLLASDDDTYTYNKRVNRIPPIQEHRMIARAMDRGVSSADIAAALNLQVESVLRRFRLLEGMLGASVITVTADTVPGAPGPAPPPPKESSPPQPASVARASSAVRIPVFRMFISPLPGWGALVDAGAFA